MRRPTIARLVIALFTVVAFAATLLGPAPAAEAAGAVQVSGVGVPGAPGPAPCDDPAHAGADYVIALTGDLEGCIYGAVTWFSYNEHTGIYMEIADELFIGAWGGTSGSFRLTERFSARFDPVTGAQVWGRCAHPIVAGSGTGDFEGVTGRLDFKDDVATGTADYRGHLKLAG